MKLFNKVVIVGVGLIGGSIGLCIKKNNLAKQVVGISRRSQTINSAVACSAIDKGFIDIRAVQEADLVVLATPVNSIIDIGAKIAKLIKPGTLVTDTGSTKKLIVGKLETKISNFVGAHPLAGSEKQGVNYADQHLFKHSVCVLTPTRKTPDLALSKIRHFWGELGCRVIYLSPAKHDKYISYISHLPHIVAFSLMQSLPKDTLFLASSGLRDTTRIAASPAKLWADVLFTNSDNVLQALKQFHSCLSGIQSAIKKKDTKALERILRQARLKRESLNQK